MMIERFEEIKAWQEARVLTRMVYELTKGERFARDFGLRDQIQRAAVSVMANISEGFDRRSRKDFRHFLGIALGSSSEVRSHLYVALDQGYIDEAAFKSVYTQAETTSRLIFGFMKRLSESIPD
jgi:four helix bundle protein